MWLYTNQGTRALQSLSLGSVMPHYSLPLSIPPSHPGPDLRVPGTGHPSMGGSPVEVLHPHQALIFCTLHVSDVLPLQPSHLAPPIPTPYSTPVSLLVVNIFEAVGWTGVGREQGFHGSELEKSTGS